MKIKLEKLKIMEKSLSKLLDKELDVIVAYKISKLVKQTTQDLTILEENRIKLVRKYSSKEAAKDGTVSVDRDKQMDFHNEFRKLLEQEVEVDFEPIPMEQLGDIKLTPIDILSLEDVVLKNTDKPKKVKEIAPKKNKKTTPKKELASKEE